MTFNTTRIGLALGAAVVALGIAAGVTASAQNTNQDPGSFRGRHMGPMGPGRGAMGPGAEGPLGMLRMFGPRLNLTDAQRDQLKSIAESHREEWKALGDRARGAREALHTAIMADQLDESLIRSKAAEVAAVEADIAVAAARAKAEAWPVLTADQQKRLKELQPGVMNGRRPPSVRGRGPQ